MVSLKSRVGTFIGMKTNQLTECIKYASVWPQFDEKCIYIKKSRNGLALISQGFGTCGIMCALLGTEVA